MFLLLLSLLMMTDLLILLSLLFVAVVSFVVAVDVRRCRPSSVVVHTLCRLLSRMHLTQPTHCSLSHLYRSRFIHVFFISLSTINKPTLCIISVISYSTQPTFSTVNHANITANVPKSACFIFLLFHTQCIISPVYIASNVTNSPALFFFHTSLNTTYLSTLFTTKPDMSFDSFYNSIQHIHRPLFTTKSDISIELF